MGFLSGLTGIFKSAAKVLDNPLTRAVASAGGLNQQAAFLSSLAGNKAGTAALLGTQTGASYDAQAYGYPGIAGNIGGNMGLLNFNTTAMPGSGSVMTYPGGSWPTGGGSNAQVVNAQPIIQATGNFPGAPVYKVLRNGKVRVGRLGRDGKAHFTRRMNPMNPRAARRAIKRIRSVRMITRAIESELPRARARAR